jgi:replicative DNA helicase
MSPDLTPPQDIDAECAVLGSMMLSKRAVEDCRDLVAPSDFYRPAHEAICAVAYALAGRREPVDAITVAAELGARGELAHIGGASYLHNLVGSVVAASSAEIVADKATRRRLIEATSRILGLATLEEGRTDELLSLAEEEIGQVAQRRNGITLKPLAETIDRTVEALSSPKPNFSRTGWADLDYHIHGWAPGRLHTIAARPGGGKSLMGLQAAIHMARQGKAVTYAVMEMDTDELNTRIIAQTANVGMTSLTDRDISPVAWDSISRIMPMLVDLPIYTDDKPSQTLDHIRAHARAVARRADLGMIVVDYIQQVASPEHLAKQPRHEQVAHTTRGLKNLARELRVPVLAACQATRPRNGENKPPTLADLRESGSIEADSDVVLSLHRNGPDDEEVECHVLKARQGRPGKFHLQWQAHFARLMSSTDPYRRNAS